MIRPAFAAAAALLTLTAGADAKDCKGTFLRRSCETSGGAACPQPIAAGTRHEFQGWGMTDGVRTYSIYRLGYWPAKDIRIEPGCRLQRED